jgi:class 3 adenylate cyclase/predicted ATPase
MPVTTPVMEQPGPTAVAAIAEQAVTWQAKLLALKRFLPEALYEPLERMPNERDLRTVAEHLQALLRTTQTYLPWPVIVAPQPTGVPLGGIQRGVFVFGDVSGFTPLSERLKRLGKVGAERIAEIINGMFNELVQALFWHGGTLLKFGGDALLGLFPAQTDEQMHHAALRAVQAGMAMQACMAKFAAVDAGGEMHTLRIKCGVSAGEYFGAHIGTLPDPERGSWGMMSYVTTGHTVNRAEQAQNQAEPGEVIVAKEVRDLLDEQVELEERNEGFGRVVHAPLLEKDETLRYVEEAPSDGLDAQIVHWTERMERLAPYLPVELLARIVSNPGQPQILPDYRQVTVMFANYLGVSDLIEAVGKEMPELITEHLNRYFNYMAQIVERYEGTLARMDQYAVGDRLVVFFGAPRVHEDDPLRAVYAALEMQRAVKDHFSALQTPEGIFRFQQRIGINTGVLFAGNVGAASLRQEYTLMGDDINMAARLMSKAGWPEIFISKRTQERVQRFVELKDRGELKVKGKETLVRTYEVRRRLDEAGKSQTLSATPFVGREEALETLQAREQGLLGKRGHILCIVGDSGLGKSRLLNEAHDWMNAQASETPPQWLDLRGLSFSEQVGYWLISQVVLSLLALKPDDSPDDVLFSLWQRGNELLGKETAREAVPFLAHMLNLKLQGEWARWVRDLDPKVRQKQILWAVREFVAAAARQRPLVLAVDDLHYADEASLSAFEDLLQVTVSEPLLLIFLFRQQREKGCWRLRDRAASVYPHRFTELQLTSLSTAESAEMFAQLLPGAVFGEAQQRELFAKTAGNPFYIEEVVRSLKDAGAVVEDEARPGYWRVMQQMATIEIPDTLQGVIMARIDRLTEDARQVLQVAAVIGRQFQKDVLHSLVQAEHELGSWLAQLERSDLIQPAGVDEGADYVFADALVQEVAYENLLVQRRQEFHRKIGLAIEGLLFKAAEGNTLLAEEMLAQQCELLAYHFERSDDGERAIRYLEMAGKKAQSEFANETALQTYSHLLTRLKQSGAEWRKIFDVLRRRQQIYALLGNKDARRADLDEMMALAGEDAAARMVTFNALADLYQWTSHYPEAIAAAQQALQLAVDLSDAGGQAEALNTMGIIAYYQAEYDQARPLLMQACQLRKAIGDPAGLAWSTMYLGMMDFMEGNFSEAELSHRHALEMARQRHDVMQTAIHLTNLGRVSLSLGKYEQALAQFQESLQLKQRVGDRTGQGFSLFNLGLVYLELERLEEAEKALRDSLTLRQQINDARGEGYCWWGLGLLAQRQGQYEQAEQALQQALEIHSRLGLKPEVLNDLAELAETALAQQRMEEAQRWIAEALQQEKAESAVRVYLAQARVYAGQPQAAEFAGRAYELVMKQAERISNLEDRHQFLSAVRVNREVLALHGAS